MTSFCNFGIGSFAGLGGSGGGGGGVSKTTAATAAATTTPRLNHSRGNNNRSHSTVSPSSSSHESVGSTSDEADQVGARELGMLTPSQRERLFEEIHGIIDVHEEDPTFISKCLLDVDEELSKIRDKSAYSRALFLAPRYVKDDNFRLMFLRATNFHPKHAAKKIVSHFKFKAELFGLTKVAKTITLDDLDEADDMIALRSGGTIFLSETDSAGRPITLAYRTKNNLKSYKSEFRAQWYSAMVALENQELQKRGAVIVCFTLDLDGPLGSGYETMSKYHMLRDGLPLRRASFHFCYNNSAMRTAVSIFRTVAGPDFRLRFRDHFGSYQECAYALLQYGINNNKFPFDENGKINHDVIDQWITRRKQKEQCIKEKEESTKEIYTPTINDVSFGERGCDLVLFLCCHDAKTLSTIGIRFSRAS